MIAVPAYAGAPGLGLSQSPSIGIACPGQPNVTTCGRIGIGVWLRRPAEEVTAIIAGRRVQLHSGGFGGTGPTYWEGYAHLTRRQLDLPPQWLGEHPTRFFRLHLIVAYPKCTAAGTTRLLLRAGWG